MVIKARFDFRHLYSISPFSLMVINNAKDRMLLLLQLSGCSFKGFRITSPFLICNIELFMYQVQFLSHTADIRMQIEADSQAEVFKGALAGMSKLIKQDFCDQNRASEIQNSIAIHSPDTTTLLIDFMNEALSLSHINKAIYCLVDILNLSASDISAVIKGYFSDEWEQDIKAVTYHEAEIREKNSKWMAHVIFDI